MLEESTDKHTHLMTISCDRCSTTTTLSGTLGREWHNKALYEMGWRVDSAARKYKHLCASCVRKRERRRKLKIEVAK